MGRPLLAATAGLVLALGAVLGPALVGAARNVERRLQEESAQRRERSGALVSERPALAPLADGWHGDVSASPTPGEAAAAAALRALGGGLLAGLALYTLTMLPLSRLADAAGRLAGDLATRAPRGPPNELGRLAADFNRMAERLAAVARDKDEFLARITHDLRSPLHGALLHADNLLAGADRAEQRALCETVEALRSEGRSLAAALEDLLELARLEGSSREACLEPIDARVALADVLERVGPTPPGFSLHAIPGAARVQADVLSFAPALEYALRLAARWSRRDERVTVSLYRGRPGELTLPIWFSCDDALQPILAAIAPRAPASGERRAALSGLEEVRLLRACRLAESAGGILELKRRDDGSWTLLATFKESP
ncbi:MAG: HAMP domain-containing histidine kinase [Elusimicrobia bacterium]|nr:HAMP domain-containing histidine kinase [Elusimicrobiota bacterium]